MDIIDVNICNLGLAKVGHKARLVSLLSDIRTTEADVARTFYKYTKNEVLGAYDWWFARAIVPLAPVSFTFEDWTYCYVVPADVGVPRHLARTSRNDTPIPFKLMQEYGGSGQSLLFTDQADAKLVATVLTDDTSKFTPLFVDALAWKLGHVFSPSLGISVDRMSYANKRYEEVLVRAQVDSANSEANHENPADTEWTKGR